MTSVLKSVPSIVNISAFTTKKTCRAHSETYRESNVGLLEKRNPLVNSRNVREMQTHLLN